jgi:hypothetical protein
VPVPSDPAVETSGSRKKRSDTALVCPHSYTHPHTQIFFKGQYNIYRLPLISRLRIEENKKESRKIDRHQRNGGDLGRHIWTIGGGGKEKRRRWDSPEGERELQLLNDLREQRESLVREGYTGHGVCVCICVCA